MDIKKHLIKLFNSQQLSSFLFGTLGAIIIAILTHFVDRPKTIATVNITKIVNAFINQERQKNLSKEMLKKETQHFGVQLEFALRKLAEKNNEILLPKEAVIAGSIDETDALYELLNPLEDKWHVSYE